MQVIRVEAFFSPGKVQAWKPESLCTEIQAPQKKRVNQQREQQRDAHPPGVVQEDRGRAQSVALFNDRVRGLVIRNRFFFYHFFSSSNTNQTGSSALARRPTCQHYTRKFEFCFGVLAEVISHHAGRLSRQRIADGEPHFEMWLTQLK
ncbi:MAG TPA: hypothetical protein VFW00_05500 [Rhodocyclaceae bacterium]|nr:hypothetical protein [Rhodocyclaceae bacterium]